MWPYLPCQNPNCQGEPLTTENPDTADRDNPRDIAEDLLHRAAALSNLLGNEHGDPSVAAQITQAMALAGAGYAQLAALDWAQEQASRQASLFGEVLTEFRAIVTGAQPASADDRPADFLLDKTDDRWTHTGNGLYESTQDSGLYDMRIETIREQWGPVREYVLRPSRRGT